MTTTVLTPAADNTSPPQFPKPKSRTQSGTFSNPFAKNYREYNEPQTDINEGIPALDMDAVQARLQQEFVERSRVGSRTSSFTTPAGDGTSNLTPEEIALQAQFDALVERRAIQMINAAQARSRSGSVSGQSGGFASAFHSSPSNSRPQSPNLDAAEPEFAPPAAIAHLHHLNTLSSLQPMTSAEPSPAFTPPQGVSRSSSIASRRRGSRPTSRRPSFNTANSEFQSFETR